MAYPLLPRGTWHQYKRSQEKKKGKKKGATNGALKKSEIARLC
jgi:hypothetical protein